MKIRACALGVSMYILEAAEDEKSYREKKEGSDSTIEVDVSQYFG